MNKLRYTDIPLGFSHKTSRELVEESIIHSLTIQRVSLLHRECGTGNGENPIILVLSTTLLVRLSICSDVMCPSPTVLVLVY